MSMQNSKSSIGREIPLSQKESQLYWMILIILWRIAVSISSPIRRLRRSSGSSIDLSHKIKPERGRGMKYDERFMLLPKGLNTYKSSSTSSYIIDWYELAGFFLQNFGGTVITLIEGLEVIGFKKVLFI